MLEAHVIGNLVNRLIATLQAHLYLVDNSLMDIVLRRHGAMLTHKVAKVVWTHIELLGTPCHSRNLIGVTSRRVDRVEQQVDTSSDIAMQERLLGIYPIKKPQTLREQHHDTAGNDSLGVLIHRVTKLHAKGLQAVDSQRALHLVDIYLLT